jgi:mono/diheme cytochrome c family protein
MKKMNLLLVALLGFGASFAHADVENAVKLEKKYASFAKAANPEYAGPSAVAGKHFFNRQIKLANGKAAACASCHTSNPADEGKHMVTGKPIKPLSPMVNYKRFSDVEKVEEQFTLHCNDIIGSDCTAEEKANYIAYLLTEKTPSKK